MEISSLSYSTLLYQLSFSSTIIDRGEYIVVCTPDFPFYHWGNFLLFPLAPQTGDFEKWTNLFEKEFYNTGCKHIAFAWDSTSGEKGEIVAFEKAGFYFEFDDILTANTVKGPTHVNSNMNIRQFNSDEDWERSVKLNIDCGDTRSYEELRKLSVHHRRDTEQGHGVLLGAFINDELVGEMALFNGGSSRGLISMVKTHPRFRRKGVCRTMLCEIVRMGKEVFSFREFVLVADVKGLSSPGYRSAGFQIAEHGASLIRKG